MSERKKEKISWIGGWLGGLVCAVVLTIVLHVDQWTVKAGTGLAIAGLGITTIDFLVP